MVGSDSSISGLPKYTFDRTTINITSARINRWIGIILNQVIFWADGSGDRYSFRALLQYSVYGKPLNENPQQSKSKFLLCHAIREAHTHSFNAAHVSASNFSPSHSENMRCEMVREYLFQVHYIWTQLFVRRKWTTLERLLGPSTQNHCFFYIWICFLRCLCNVCLVSECMRLPVY